MHEDGIPSSNFIGLNTVAKVQEYLKFTTCDIFMPELTRLRSSCNRDLPNLLCILHAMLILLSQSPLFQSSISVLSFSVEPAFSHVRAIYSHRWHSPPLCKLFLHCNSFFSSLTPSTYSQIIILLKFQCGRTGRLSCRLRACTSKRPHVLNCSQLVQRPISKPL